MALALLAGAFAYAYLEIEWFRNFVDNQLVPALKIALKVALDIARTAVEFFVAQVVNRFHFLVTILSEYFQFFKALFTGDWSAALESLKNIAVAVLTFIKDEFFAWRDLIVGVFAAFGVDLPALFRTAANGVLSVIERMVNGVIDGINKIISAWNNFSISSPGLNILGVQVIPAFTFDTPDVPLIPGVTLARLGGPTDQSGAHFEDLFASSGGYTPPDQSGAHFEDLFAAGYTPPPVAPPAAVAEELFASSGGYTPPPPPTFEDLFGASAEELFAPAGYTPPPVAVPGSATLEELFASSGGYTPPPAGRAAAHGGHRR